ESRVFGGALSQEIQFLELHCHESVSGPASQLKTSSSFTPNTSAIRKAVSRVGEYLPCSIAATAWRVTPIRIPSSAWVISPEWKRRVGMVLERRLLAIPASAVADDDVELVAGFGDHDDRQCDMDDLPGGTGEGHHPSDQAHPGDEDIETDIGPAPV